MFVKHFLAMFLVLLAAACPSAQTDPSDVNISLHEYHNTDLRLVLKRMFGMVGVSFSMEDSIKGKITLNLPPLRFDTALQVVLKSCALTYRCEGSIYQIVRRESPSGGVDLSSQIPQMPDLEPDSFLDSRAPEIKEDKANADELLWTILNRSNTYFVIGYGLDLPVSIEKPVRTNRYLLTQITRTTHSFLCKSLDKVWIVVGPPAKPAGEARWPVN